jgi:hypothetical protein
LSNSAGEGLPDALLDKPTGPPGRLGIDTAVVLDAFFRQFGTVTVVP